MTYRKPYILCFGSINIDEVYEVPHIVRSGQTISSANRSIGPGGKGANQAYALGVASNACFLAGCVGNDGLWILEDLEKAQVDTSMTEHRPEGQTGRAIIQLSKETRDNAIVLFPGVNREISLDYIHKFIHEKRSESKWLVVQNEINSVDLIIQEAANLGNWSIVFNPAPCTPDIVRNYHLDKIHYLVVNEHEACDIYAQTGASSTSDYETIMRELAEKFPNLLGIIITLGGEGVCARFKYNRTSSAREYRLSAIQVQAVDTTCAGDAFVGYFVGSLATEWEKVEQKSEDTYFELVEKSLKIAMAAGALTVSKSGAMRSIPTLSEVKKKAAAEYSI
ncbi:uncharacterized protein VTP21DRAFT_191 [Calcarisporiella thermophila]|uniref:uncharacterized protein n=1 Tax=Calcarisporiella thermophila TaxID=911321 RepID=UPI00374253C1